MSQDYAPAILDIVDGHYWEGHDSRRAWIIIHATAGGNSPYDTAAWFKEYNQASSHYVIGRDGTVLQCVLENDTAWANGYVETGCDVWWSGFPNPNYVTISIEHVKSDNQNAETITPAQQAASFALVEHLCSVWKIPRQHANEHGGITGHFSMQPISRARCPGPYPFDKLITYLNRDEEMMPSTVTDTGTELRYAGYEFVVVRGFRQYMLANKVWWLGAPRSNEAQSANVRLNTTGIAGVVQVFEYGVLAWEKETGSVYPLQSGDVLVSFAKGTITQGELALAGV